VQAGKVTVIETFDLQPTLQKWFAGGKNGFLSLGPGDDTFNLNGRKGTLRINVRNADIRKENDGVQLQHLSGYLFLKKK
jgi:hypothetical protein